MKKTIAQNNRGIALLTVLLVTALLIALIFEFAFGTRISLNNAIGFRNSERAYFLASAGIKAFKAQGPQLCKLIPPGTDYPLDFLGDDDTKVQVRWEDEQGKIRITDVKTDPITQSMVATLLENKNIDSRVYERMTDPATSNINNLTFLSGLHAYMSDDDFFKIKDSLTVSPNVTQHIININAASADVLRSMGINQNDAELIVQRQQEKAATNEKAYTAQDITDEKVPGISGIRIPPGQSGSNFIKNYLTADDPKVIKVISSATIDGYTKTIEAILYGSSVTYWRAL